MLGDWFGCHHGARFRCVLCNPQDATSRWERVKAWCAYYLVEDD